MLRIMLKWARRWFQMLARFEFRFEKLVNRPSKKDKWAGKCTGTVRRCTGTVRGLYGDCTGIVRELYGDCTGIVRGLYGILRGLGPP